MKKSSCLIFLFLAGIPVFCLAGGNRLVDVVEVAIL